VSEWLLFNSKWGICQLYHDKNKLHFNEWVSDCCLTPKWAIFQPYHDKSKLHFNEWVSDWCLTLKWAIFQPYHDKNKLHFNEWVSDCCLTLKSAIFQPYHDKNKLHFNIMIMKSALYETNTLNFFFIVLAHWNNSSHVDMSINSDTLSWFWAEPTSLLLLLNATC
jgi:hypothetical protein